MLSACLRLLLPERPAFPPVLGNLTSSLLPAPRPLPGLGGRREMPEPFPAAVSVLPLESREDLPPRISQVDMETGRVTCSLSGDTGQGHGMPGKVYPTSVLCCHVLSGAGRGKGQVPVGGQSQGLWSPEWPAHAVQDPAGRDLLQEKRSGQVPGAGERRWVWTEETSQCLPPDCH